MATVTFDCWCGAEGVTVDYSELEPCRGSGYRDCLCGGDFCICHFHGGEQCDGCSECGFDDDEERYGADDDGDGG